MTYSYDRTAGEIKALGIAFNAAKGVLKDAEEAASMVADARKLIKANSRPISFVAAALHDIEDARVKRNLWNEYTKLNPEDPDIGAFAERLGAFVQTLKEHKATAENIVEERAVWDQHNERRRPGWR